MATDRKRDEDPKNPRAVDDDVLEATVALEELTRTGVLTDAIERARQLAQRESSAQAQGTAATSPSFVGAAALDASRNVSALGAEVEATGEYLDVELHSIAPEAPNDAGRPEALHPSSLTGRDAQALEQTVVGREALLPVPPQANALRIEQRLEETAVFTQAHERAYEETVRNPLSIERAYEATVRNPAAIAQTAVAPARREASIVPQRDAPVGDHEGPAAWKSFVAEPAPPEAPRAETPAQQALDATKTSDDVSTPFDAAELELADALTELNDAIAELEALLEFAEAAP